jgi:hypothetical protein
MTVAIALLLALQQPADAAGMEFFEKKVRPVLIDRCYSCHSATAKKVKGGLLLDTREGTLKGGESGVAIVPGHPEKSRLVTAVRWSDPDLQMPPKEKLPDDEIAALEEWVKRGAPDPRSGAAPPKPGTDPRAFWSFRPPVDRPGTIDDFVAAKLKEKGLAPNPPADPRTLLRRATFDLTGLPPTAEETAAFLADTSPDAFARVVDRLLASPRYGERWGRHWLDVARYADTKGDVFDEERRYPNAWTYRDWVIRALNDDMPYDRFVLLQLAADGDERAALGFLTVGRRFNNNVHDIIDDRIDVVIRGLQGLTIGCARCHDHKYDPLPTKDYYSLYGVFASCQEPKAYPLLPQAQKSDANAAFEKEFAIREGDVTKYLQGVHARVNGELHAAPSITAHLLAAAEARETADKDLRPIAQRHQVKDLTLRKWRAWLKADLGWLALAAIPEKEFAEKSPAIVAAIGDVAVREWLAEPPATLPEAAQRYAQALAGRDALPSVDLAEVEQVWSPKDRDKVRDLRKKLGELEVTHPGAPPRAMAIEDKPQPVEPVIFVRGNAGQRGEKIPRKFLTVFSNEPFKEGSGRGDLAKAIASKDNPLTARVIVNRAWLWHFGQGIVRTPSDFGTRGDPPSHPELLDALAARFMADEWSLKRLHRAILLSKTWQQSSADNAAARAVDPGNALLWRMNRERLDLEALRDSVLAVTGQLDGAMGGRSNDLATQPFTRRRTVYGFIDRQNLPGMFRTFDFASPDISNPQRYITTVPQQALFLMNNPFIAEQAHALASRPDVAGEPDPEKRIRLLTRIAYGREAEADEVARALAFLGTEAAPSRASDWHYGYGEVDSAAQKVKSFTAMAHFTGGAWTADPKGSAMTLTAAGGRPGKGPAQAVIRRWVAPRDGTVSIAGPLAHHEREGDGVEARIVSSREGEIARWTLQHLEAEARISGLAVKRGDTIDFVVDGRGNPDADAFSWSPVVKMDQDEWNAARDFAGPAAAVGAWEQYVQVLLLSNEFAFID